MRRHSRRNMPDYRRDWTLAIPVGWLVVSAARPCAGGMPAMLPEDIQVVLRLNEEPHQRLQAISFFLGGILLAAVGWQGIWNFLRRDFPALPSMSLPRAVSFILLLGGLSVVVLTMISGARELMSPGAWKKDGLTYVLDDQQPAGAVSVENLSEDPKP